MTKMKTSSYRRISKGKIQGWMKEEILGVLPPTFFEDPVCSIREMGGAVIKESRLRWAAMLTLPDGRRIFFKRDRTKGWLESLKFLFLPSKARREWLIAYQLQKRNLNIPKPLGWMERYHRGFVRESFYLSEAIGSGASLMSSVQLGEGFPINELAKKVRRFHDSGLFHRDLHAGNLLWDGTSFFLTDLHRTKIIRSVSLNQRLCNLSQLFHSLRSIWGEKDHLGFIETYFAGKPLGDLKKKELLRKVHSLMNRFQTRQWESRTKRCLKESTEFSIRKEKGFRYYHRRDFSLNQIKKVLEDHVRVIKARSSALKKLSGEIIVSLLNDGGDKLCIKQFCYPHPWDRFKEHFRRSRGLKSWIGGNGLRARGISSVKPLALVEGRSWIGLMESFLIMESSQFDQEMDRYILKGFDHSKQKRLFIKAFAKWLTCLHQRDLYHQDMKTCNILVSANGETWDFLLLDLEDVLLDKKVDGRKLFKNFLQLNTSTPTLMTRTDRFRFFREYQSLNPIIKNEKAFLRRLIEESKRRGLVYVSSQGVVEEK